MKIIERMVQTKFIVNDFGEFELDRVYNLIEELEGTSRYGIRTHIFDEKLKEWLIAEKVVDNTPMGSCYRFDNFDNFANKLDDIINKI